jgi:hypothetical protein
MNSLNTVIISDQTTDILFPWKSSTNIVAGFSSMSPAGSTIYVTGELYVILKNYVITKD